VSTDSGGKRALEFGGTSIHSSTVHCVRVFHFWLAILAALAFQPARAATSNIEAELIAESPVPAGGTVTLAIHMKPKPGWHGYWRNPGDAGLGMTLDWALPPGVKVGEPRYPVPRTLIVSGLMNHVYESDYAVLVPLTLTPGFDRNVRVPIAVEARWLACTDEICVPESGRLETLVEINRAYERDKRFDAWRAALPAPLGAQARFALSGNRIRLGIPLPASLPLESPHFFVGEDKTLDYAAPQRFSRKGDLLIIDMARPDIAAATPAGVTGVLRLNRAGDGVDVLAVPGEVPTGGIPLVEEPAPQLPALGWLLLAALAGGLLLNVMPCVFPILSLKAMSLVRAGESEAQARGEGLAYTAGVIFACMALGGVLLALRAAGSEVGWAFQLQEPAVVAALALLAAALTANFLGLFEFAVPGLASEGSPRGAFATGLLAAFVATPCTGPFMAAAMGAALLMPVGPALLLFAALGLGIALPFLLIALVPALRRRLPRPGRWMVTFRRWMALPMGLTALALLWLASRLGGMNFALALAACVLVLAGALWAVGRVQRSGRAARGAAAIAILVAVAAIIGLPQTVRTPSGGEGEGVLPAEPFSEAALAQARASGKPVFVWFTADWCLTCKVNETVAIEREPVRRAFEKADVVALKGDWTRRDPAITRFLTAQGAAGVPLYLWYPAGGGAPRQLPQVLGPDSLTELVER
jgi:DsbC/DsbD-like thiol-disulfide interchange protein/cytochrome c biogenesis protein CcdA